LAQFDPPNRLAVALFTGGKSVRKDQFWLPRRLRHSRRGRWRIVGQGGRLA